MEKLYYGNTYQKNTSCKVTAVNYTDKATEVLTDKTVFYPECGGQPGDQGMLGPYKVLDTRKAEDGDSVLILEKGCDVQVGQQLELVLDWEHRYKYMAMHTCQHLLSGTLFNLHGIGTVAVHLGSDYLTIEVDRANVTQQQIDSTIKSANRSIMEAHPIIYHEMAHSDAEALGMRRSIKVEGDVRIVEIKDVDRIACGGVHVANTSEIRLVYNMGHEQIRGHERLYFVCGDEALSNALQSLSISSRLNSMLSSKTHELEEKVSTLLAQNTELKAQKTNMAKGLATMQVKASVDSDGICIINCPEGSDLQAYGQAISEFKDLALCVLCPDGDRTKWLIGLKGRFEKVDFNAIRSNLLSAINAKGGGRTPLFQGVAQCNDKTLMDGFVTGFRGLVSIN